MWWLLNPDSKQSHKSGMFQTTTCIWYVSNNHIHLVCVKQPHASGMLQTITYIWYVSNNNIDLVCFKQSHTSGIFQTIRYIWYVSGSSHDTRSLANAARSCFSKLVCQLPSVFGSLQPDPYNGGRDKSSLTKFLAHGLNRVLAHTALDGKPSFSPSQVSMG